MYPDGGVSDIQYKQMATQAGSNVMVWAVKAISMTAKREPRTSETKHLPKS